MRYPAGAIQWIADIKSRKIKRMKVTREDVATKLRAYLRHELSLAELVDWAEQGSRI